MKPTHVHRQHATRAARIGTAQGEGQLAGKSLVIYLDLSTQPPATHYIEAGRWEAEWREIPADACPVCHGSGTDQIKKRKDRPCGGCYGLGRVRQDGETPKGAWEVAEVALGIIQRQARIIEQRDQVLAFPEVQEVLKARKERQQQEGPPDWVQREQDWRGSRGRGPGGARMTGD